LGRRTNTINVNVNCVLSIVKACSFHRFRAISIHQILLNFLDVVNVAQRTTLKFNRLPKLPQFEVFEEVVFG
jgi:hypothetical protein